MVFVTYESQIYPFGSGYAGLGESACNRGVVYEVNHRYDQAIADYTKALEINPSYAGGYHNRGVAYGRKGQYDKALADFTKSIALNPRYAGAYYSRGNVYGKLGKHDDQAIADYTKALEVNPRYALAYYSRGRVYYLRKEYGKSMEDVNKAQALGYKIPAEFLDDLHKASGK
jgi:tetratricopeptide (TPR) repeat protein